TATAGQDYTAVQGTLTIPPNTPSATIGIPLLDDDVWEPNETLRLTLSNPTNAVLRAPSEATLTILDDADVTPHAFWLTPDVRVREDAGVAELGVQLDAEATHPVTLGYATHDDTAVAGSDYTAQTGTVTIPAGNRSAWVTIPIAADTTVEPDESFTVTLVSPV